MTYSLRFLPTALKEWKKLGHNIREQFKNKLAERLKNPRVISAQLYGLKDCYKIKLRASGYRLIYEVNDKEIYVMVIAIAKRDKSYVYALAEKRAKRID
jgi:mRNA interferase RelE/StbE